MIIPEKASIVGFATTTVMTLNYGQLHIRLVFPLGPMDVHVWLYRSRDMILKSSKYCQTSMPYCRNVLSNFLRFKLFPGNFYLPWKFWRLDLKAMNNNLFRFKYLGDCFCVFGYALWPFKQHSPHSFPPIC